MESTLTTLTERGQVSLPASLRRQLRLKPGQPLLWKIVSDQEIRVVVVRQPDASRSHSLRGFMKPFQKGSPKTTAGWMKLLREGEKE